jgi:hypothetical protein
MGCHGGCLRLGGILSYLCGEWEETVRALRECPLMR